MKNPSHRFIYNLRAIHIVFYFAVTLKRVRAQISYSSNKNLRNPFFPLFAERGGKAKTEMIKWKNYERVSAAR